MIEYILFGLLIALPTIGIVVGLVIMRRQRDVRRFEPMFERLLSEMQVEHHTRDTMRRMRDVAKDHFRDDTWR